MTPTLGLRVPQNCGNGHKKITQNSLSSPEERKSHHSCNGNSIKKKSSPSPALSKVPPMKLLLLSKDNSDDQSDT